DASSGHVTVDEATPAGAPGVVHAHVSEPNASALEFDLTPTGPGQYAGTFDLAGPGTYLVRVEEQREGASVGAAEAGLPVAYSAEFRQVTADTRRMEQIARAGGGHVLVSPADAFANDLLPITTPLPLQRVLVLIAAILLPLEVGLRRLRFAPADLLEWLRHPARVPLALPRWSTEAPLQPPAWLPGVWSTRRSPPPPLNRATAPAEQSLGTLATPGLARETPVEGESDEDDALGATLRWLAARRRSSGDSG
ncbi:MAG TPA: hypothetical protein VF937_06510, partial [Chloroflexota bacterium]